MVYLGTKSYWDLPNGLRADTFEMLLDELQRHWALMSNDYPGVEDIRVIGIDLTRRGIDAKAVKAAKVAKKAAKASRKMPKLAPGKGLKKRKEEASSVDHHWNNT